MQKKIEEHIFQGMQRDISISKQKPEYLWDAHNIRLTARQGDTLLSMTNERGTKEINLNFEDPKETALQGVVLGYCVLGEYLTVFTTVITPATTDSLTYKPDYIYRLLKVNDGFDVKILYNGNLNFSVNYPIECLGVYENVDIQKIYWTDGRNQPRFINITKNIINPEYNNTSFDFIPTLALKDSIHVKKVADSSGLFPAGVIQYAVTYFNKYAQESNISVVSPLIPTSYTSRAGGPEETIGNAFKITIKNPDTLFEYLRLYSIFRSTKDTTPVCKHVTDVKLGEGSGTAILSKKLIISSDRRNVFSARYKISSLKVKLDIDSDYITVGNVNATLPDYIGQEDITLPWAAMLPARRYIHFQVDEHPNLIIQLLEINNDGSTAQSPTFFTWGDSTDIYLSLGVPIKEEGDNGPGYDNALIIVGGQYGNPGVGDMIAASDIHWGDTLIIDTNTITITDNNTIGETVDTNELLFVGGEEITAGTITQKDGTMFLGDIKIKRPQIEGNYDTIDLSEYEIVLDDETHLIDESNENNRNIVKVIRKGTTINKDFRKCWFPLTMNSETYKWCNTLDAGIWNDLTNEKVEESTNIAGFKYGEHYRLGLLFQYKTGKWSQPVFIGDEIMTSDSTNRHPSLNIWGDNGDGIPKLNIPIFKATLASSVGNYMLSKGYKRVRAVVCFPSESDLLILCLGLINPTVFSIAGRINHTPDIQSSWYFRPIPKTENRSDNGLGEGGIPQHKHFHTLYSGDIGRYNTGSGTDNFFEASIPSRDDEILGVPAEFSNKPLSWFLNLDQLHYFELKEDSLNEGQFIISGITVKVDSSNDEGRLEFTFTDKDQSKDLTNIYAVDWNYLTFHSPEFEFNDSFHNIDASTLDCQLIGKYTVGSNQGDIHITTSSPPIATDAPGFYHRTVLTIGSARRINAGLFYKDSLVTYYATNDDRYKAGTPDINYPFVTYPWHRTGSLNNDCIRPYNTGSRTGVLAQKKISNLMYFDSMTTITSNVLSDTNIRIFNSDQISLVKINDKNYFGNIDLVINPFYKYNIGYSENESFTGDLKYLSTNGWDTSNKQNELGTILSNDPVYMKYKSTPHGVIYTSSSFINNLEQNQTLTDGQISLIPDGIRPYLYCAEIYRTENTQTDFGGTSQHAIQSNLWYPAGPAVRIGFDINEVPLNNDLGNATTVTSTIVGKTVIPFWYGDTYYLRYDCLKTYPFTDEDTNSIIEIGSFMVETRINLDGRYDKNRANISNFTLNPTNYNIINPVYSQMDNFFNYRILDEDYYSLSNYPTMVSWTGYKNNAAEVDSWTNLTLSSTLEMDGTKGKVNAVRVNSDQLYCFQDDAIGQILFNSRVQISPSDGVPIEISNNYKVDGNRYISTSIGCKNKWSIAEGVDGLYFIDDNTKALYMLCGQAQLKPISTPLNMSYWFMKQDTATPWLQHYYDGTYRFEQQGIRCFYDNVNADLYICTPEKTLCYSEKLGQFVSFYDYHNVMGMFNMDSEYYALNYPDTDDRLSIVKLWGMFQGKYNTFFSKTYLTDFTFISNENPLNDKIFSNIELRGDFRYWPNNEPLPNFDSSDHEIDHRKMFDTVRVWNEYQDTGDIDLNFIDDVPSNMKKKFRIWRMDIPRDKDNFRQRIRNTWTKVKFTMNNPNYDDAPYNPGTGPLQAPAYNFPKLYDMEIHDIGVVYFV